MKTLVFFILSIFFSVNVISQNFDELPYNYLQKQVAFQVDKQEVKRNIPVGYTIVNDESTKLVCEKKLNNRIYEIQYFFEQGNLTGVTFIQHSSRIWKILEELESLKFSVVDNITLNGIETTMFEKKPYKLGAIVIYNEEKRIVSCILSKTK